MTRHGTHVAVVALIALALASCGQGDDQQPAAGEEEINIQWGHSSNESESLHIAATQVAENVAERTDGRVTIDVFANEQLGTLPELHERAAAGAALMLDTNPGFASEYGVPELGILQGPFLFDSPEDLLSFVDTPLMQEWEDGLEENGLHSLSWDWYYGQRHLIGSQPYPDPAALSGAQVRTSGNPVQTATFDALGAIPVELSRSETYSALSQGVVDATDGPFSQLLGDSLYEVADEVSVTGHVDMIQGILIGAEFFDSLPEDVQSIIEEEVAAAGERYTQLSLETGEEDRQELADNGVTINEVDREAFRDAADAFYGGDANPAWTAELRDEVRAATGG